MSASPTDDATIADEEELLRRIPPQWVVPDGNSGGVRIASAAFDNDSDGSPTSIVLSSELNALKRAPESVLEGHTGFLLAALKAKVARDEGQGVVRDPLPDEPAHGLIVGEKKKPVQRRLAKAARWVVGPTR